MHLYVARELLEAGLHFAIDFRRRQFDVDAALELIRLFHCCCHVISYACVLRVLRVRVLVRKEGLEPTRLSAPEPKSGASTNSATFATL